jgi:HD superfamily phosphodiesterase
MRGRVAGLAKRAAKQLSLPDALVAAARLHDIGYAPDLVETGIHPLNGARYQLRSAGIDGQIVSLVVYPLVCSDRS